MVRTVGPISKRKPFSSRQAALPPSQLLRSNRTTRIAAPRQGTGCGKSAKSGAYYSECGAEAIFSCKR